MENTKQPKNKESWEVFTKKTFYDKSYRYHIMWWPLFIILLVLVVTFFFLGLIAIIYCWDYSRDYFNTLINMLLVSGYLILFLFSIFWICNNFLNNSIDKIKVKSPDLHPKIKRNCIFFNIVRFFILGMVIICGLLNLTAGYMLKDGSLVVDIKAIVLVSFLIYCLLAIPASVLYYFYFSEKYRILDEIVIKEE